jgi:arylsulfatase A-like enzyme
VLALWAVDRAVPAGGADPVCPAKPNIILFVADDLAWVHLPFFTTPAKWTNNNPNDSAEISPPGRISRGPRVLVSPTLNRLDARLFADRTTHGLLSAYVPPGPGAVTSYPVTPVDLWDSPGPYVPNHCDDYPMCDPGQDVLQGHGGLKRLADDGIIFTRFYATSVVCSPTRASLMTGRHGFKTGATGLRHAEKLQEPGSYKTIARYLKDHTCPPNGTAPCYRTGLIGKWHVTKEDPEDLDPDPEYPGQYVAAKLGFDEVLGDNKAKRGDFSHKQLGCHPPGLSLGVLGVCDNAGQFLMEGNRSACTDDASPALPAQCNFSVRVFGDLAENFIDRHQGEKFFLVVSFNAVHDPHTAPRRTEAHYTTDGPEGREKGHRARGGGKSYWAQIEEMDAAIGRVMARLDALQLTDDTLVIFTGDQGQDGFEAPWGEPQLAGFKTVVKDGGIRVPFIASACGAGDTCNPAEEDCRTDRVASHVDLLRTIAEAAGIQAQLSSEPEAYEVEGQSFWTALNTRDATAGTERDFAFAAEELRKNQPGGKYVAVTTRAGYATAATFFNAINSGLYDPMNAPNGICGYEGIPISSTTQHRLRGASCKGCTPGADPDDPHAACAAQTCVILGGRCLTAPTQSEVILQNASRCTGTSECGPNEICYTDLTIPCDRCRPPAWKLIATINASKTIDQNSKIEGLYDLESNPEEQDGGAGLDLDCQEEFGKVKDELACTVNDWTLDTTTVPLENGILEPSVVGLGRSCLDH